MKEKNILNTNLSFSVLTANIISLLLFGTLKLFPVQAFLTPVVIGVIVQSLFIEMAITWTSIAIAIAGVMTALKNEMIFKENYYKIIYKIKDCGIYVWNWWKNYSCSITISYAAICIFKPGCYRRKAETGTGCDSYCRCDKYGW